MPRQLTKANKSAAQLVAVEAIRLAPKGTHEGGGAVVPISQSIKAVASAQKVSVVAGGKNTPHAAPTEWGGRIARRGFKGLNRRGKAAARAGGSSGILTHIKRQPYLMPAVKNKLGQVVQEYRKAIDVLIAKL
jgi:hypothetical protein